MYITEIYKSIQGESTFAGLPCVFVRLTGCNLRCDWCDSEYTFTGGHRMALIRSRQLGPGQRPSCRRTGAGSSQLIFLAPQEVPAGEVYTAAILPQAPDPGNHVGRGRRLVPSFQRIQNFFVRSAETSKTGATRFSLRA